VLARQIEDASFAAVVIGQGWADQDTLGAMAADFRSWGELADAYLAFFKCAAVGFAPES
jgi:hypothetical protein